MATSSEQLTVTAPSANLPAQQSVAEGSDGTARGTTPVEMRTLASALQSTAQPISSGPPQLSLPPKGESSLSQDIAEARSEGATPTQKTTAQPSSSTAQTAEAPALTTTVTNEGIGPNTDSPVIAAATNPDISEGPVITITLLLTNGARHPYRVDGKYLKRRKIAVEENDPRNISVYTLKELILRDWRSEWEAKPSSPSSIRLIHFGRMLDDKVPLKDCRFQTESPNVVHMTIKPQEIVDEEETRTGKGGSRRDGDDETHAGCRCVIL
ncbi:ubiquitin-like protein [Mytilinidion resinicola]|uniref:Ubiquitin-like protein n=1 Tax=Mytilinidion resinicola TaxID=574789 RepID=A0A6A6YXE8_9PEZI|nr:ubiquitin-like protein [Mytilinidion resinicola]KAF2813491.1 ubiquitin-like protein [Mytilinidion resinicola]